MNTSIQATAIRRVGAYAWCGALLAASLLLLLALQRLPSSAGTLEMDMTAARTGVAQLYFDRGDGLSEHDSVSQPLRPGRNHLAFELPTGRFALLRLDPDVGDTPVIIHSARLISAGGSDPIVLPLDKVTPGSGIAQLSLSSGGLEATLSTGANDPQLLLALDPPVHLVQPAHRLLGRLALALSVLVLCLCATIALWKGRIDRDALIGSGFVLAVTLAAIMAATTTLAQSIHPDEFSHLVVYQYFREHWLPPALTDPAVIPRLSGYGYSYLLELDLVYPIAARLMAPLQSLFAGDLAAARFFNLLLLAGLATAALLRRRWRLCLAAALITPQAWYVFSYFNADALPLALGLLCAALIGDRESGLNAYLERRGRLGAGAWLFAIALGLLLVSKRNYLPLLPGFTLWLAVCHLGAGWSAVAAILAGLALTAGAIFLESVPSLAASGVHTTALIAGAALLLIFAAALVVRCWRDHARRPALLRLATVFALAVAIAAPRVLYDWWLNGGPAERSAQMDRLMEQHAHHDFKPSTQAAGNGYVSRALAIKGVSVRQVLFEPYQWLALSAISAFGVYGHLTVFAPDWTYALLGLLALGLIAFGAYALARARPHDAGRLLLVAAGTAMLVGLISLLHSWTFDLQRQGRYLLPILPVVGMLLAAGGERLPDRPFKLLLAAAIVVSAFSFAGFGLPALMAAR